MAANSREDLWITGEVDMSEKERGRVKRREKKKPSETGKDRRVFERQVLDRNATFMELDEFGNPGSMWACRVVDVSRGGMGIRSRRMVHDGRFVFVIVDMGPGKPNRIFGGVVKQSRYAQGEGYAVGVEFREAPRTPMVKQWMAKNGVPSVLAGQG